MLSTSIPILFWMLAVVVAPTLALSSLFERGVARGTSSLRTADRFRYLHFPSFGMMDRSRSNIHPTSLLQLQNSMNGEDDDHSDDDPDDSSELDMTALQKRIDRQMTQYYDLLFGQQNDLSPSQSPPDEVHIIIFRPDTPEQGVHAVEYPKGSGKNFLLAFESMEECESFAQMLKDMHFGSGRGSAGYDPPTPVTSPWEPLLEYCNIATIPVRVVPSGTGLTPPSDEVDNIEWQSNENSSIVEELNERLVENDDIEASRRDGTFPEEPGAWE